MFTEAELIKNPKCSICMVDFEVQCPVAQLPCCHLFHHHVLFFTIR